MRTVFILALGIQRLRLWSRTFGPVDGRMLESVATTLVFMAMNLRVAVAAVLAVCGLTATFVSIYVTDNAVWMGIVFSRRPHVPMAAGLIGVSALG